MTTAPTPKPTVTDTDDFIVQHNGQWVEDVSSLDGEITYTDNQLLARIFPPSWAPFWKNLGGEKHKTISPSPNASYAWAISPSRTVLVEHFLKSPLNKEDLVQVIGQIGATPIPLSTYEKTYGKTYLLTLERPDKHKAVPNEEILSQAEKLVALLKEPEEGLMSWHGMLIDRVKTLRSHILHTFGV
jgi:hypothetical protein